MRTLRTAPGIKVSLVLCRGHAAWSPDGSALAVQDGSTLTLLSTRGRWLERFCRVASDPLGVAWGRGRTAPASGSSMRLRRCPPPSTGSHVPDEWHATATAKYCFRVGSGNRRRLRCVTV
jgi:hypothetical protein